jgi:hypothetical protein
MWEKIKISENMNIGLIIFGVIIMAVMFYLTNYYITPQQKQQLELIDTACNFNAWGIPIGQIGQAISPDIAQKCEEVKTAKQILSFQPYVYGFGGLMIILGLVTGGKREVHVIREVERPRHRESEDESEEEEAEEKPKKGSKFCSKCGNRIKIGEKFCGSCGAKVK